MKLPKPLLDVKFKEIDGEHFYVVNGRDTSYKGVTTFINETLAKNALVPWAAKLTAETYTELLLDRILTLTVKDLPSIEKEAKSAPRKVRDDAGDIGTIVHNAIDAYLLKGEGGEFKDTKAADAFGRFLEWWTGRKWSCVCGDTPVASVTLGYGGRLDVMFENETQRLILGDIKTSKGVYESHFVQLGGYSVAFKETYGISPSGAGILHVRPDFCRWIDCPDLSMAENAWLSVKKTYDEMKKLNKMLEGVL